jgi:hypothetical protein
MAKLRVQSFAISYCRAGICRDRCLDFWVQHVRSSSRVWPDNNWKGWWGDEASYHVLVFALTHHARPPLTDGWLEQVGFVGPVIYNPRLS